MTKKRIINSLITILGLFLMLISYGKQSLKYYRIVLLCIGFILFLIGFVLLFRKKIRNIPLFIIFCIVITFLFDSIIAITFSRIPIFSYNVITNNNSRVYNAIGYRVWACEGKPFKVDTLYKLGYYCDVKDMEEMNSNAFLGEVVDRYDDYKNKYIKINGKISRKEGINYIEMQSYQSTEVSLNGYVSFADNVTLRVVFKNGANELSSYDIYDNITVVGKIWYLRETTDNKYIVYMDDSKIIDEVDYNNFEIIITDQDNCELDRKLLHKAADYNLYSSCLNNVIVKFNKDNIYEISSVLSSGKLSINNILNKKLDIQKESGTENELYIYEKFNIIKCSESTGGDIIIGNKLLTFENAYCGVYVENNDSV